MRPGARGEYMSQLRRLTRQLSDGELTLSEWEKATDRVTSEWEQSCERDAENRRERHLEQRHD